MSTPAAEMSRLENFIPFDCLSESHLQEIQGQIEVITLAPGRLLFKRGQTSDKAYFLVEGSLDLTDASFQVRHFAADDDENYLALDNYPEHTINAISAEASTLYAIDRNKLDLLMTWTQAAESMLDEDDDESERDWMDALLSSELFAAVPPAMIHSLFVKFEEREVQLGETIVSEGEDGDTFFVIKQGKAMVSRTKGAKQETLAALSAGRFFGEDALISDSPRNASVTMTSDGVVMALGKKDFQAILQDSVIRHLTEDELDTMVLEADTACILVDVRLPMEFRHDRTPGARNIPLNELRKEVQNLEKDFFYVVCGDGRRSELGAYILSEAGLNAYVLDRGKPADAEQSNNVVEQA
ncbi:cAMP-dependent protein kinase regulatory chain [Alcanivorax nanhaiticus]|uniref:cAMP-dependent protein kinase regulatory chain n=1 Tax=Alcanivorax nanhaiticus TaxID=1177154 RepID=A0A095SIN0_9GAMM|nr:cyclic nucleotide-binding domain-containing protein [Alcanivorax nanhaiticus]KGD64437.1 cAMP-dependent protein kinase regulatory chain [Alcanivorax nanhaiticus]